MGTMAKKEKLKLKDMMEVLKNDRPLQCYIASGASDKITQQVASQTIINTMLGGIIIGDMSISLFPVVTHIFVAFSANVRITYIAISGIAVEILRVFPPIYRKTKNRIIAHVT